MTKHIDLVHLICVLVFMIWVFELSVHILPAGLQPDMRQPPMPWWDTLWAANITKELCEVLKE